jgi:hypothetical protein
MHCYCTFDPCILSFQTYFLSSAFRCLLFVLFRFIIYLVSVLVLYLKPKQLIFRFPIILSIPNMNIVTSFSINICTVEVLRRIQVQSNLLCLPSLRWFARQGQLEDWIFLMCNSQWRNHRLSMLTGRLRSLGPLPGKLETGTDFHINNIILSSVFFPLKLETGIHYHTPAT